MRKGAVRYPFLNYGHDARNCVVVAVYEKYELKMNCLTKKNELVMFTTREIAGHGWCVFDAKTGIMVRENLTWEGVMEFAVMMHLPCSEYVREWDEIILY